MEALAAIDTWFQKWQEVMERMGGEDKFFGHFITSAQDEVSLLRPCDADRLKAEDEKLWPHLHSWLLRQKDLPERTRQHICEHRSTTTEPDGSVTCNRCYKNATVNW